MPRSHANLAPLGESFTAHVQWMATKMSGLGLLPGRSIQAEAVEPRSGCDRKRAEWAEMLEGACGAGTRWGRDYCAILGIAPP